jgi:stage II sporulation protein M
LNRRVDLFSIAVRMRPYLLAALSLFAGGALAGGLLGPELRGWLLPMERGLRQEAFQLSRDTRLEMAFALFVNNLKVSLLMLFGGFVLAFIPAMGAVTNGALVGFVVEQLATVTHANLLLLIFAGILPHGLFEIPAYLLASGSGIRFGWLALRSLAGEGRQQEWRTAWQDLAPTILWMIGLLFAAALIETNVTPLLLRAAVGYP